MKETIQSLLEFSEESFDRLLKIATEKEVAKYQVLFRPDKPTNKILFLKEGLLRGYKISDGKDYTHHFYFENWFATDFSSFLNQKALSPFFSMLQVKKIP